MSCICCEEAVISPARLASVSSCLVENLGSKSVKGLDRTAVLNVERTAVPTYCEVYLAASHDVVQEGIDSVKLQNEEWRVSRNPATFICKSYDTDTTYQTHTCTVCNSHKEYKTYGVEKKWYPSSKFFPWDTMKIHSPKGLLGTPY